MERKSITLVAGTEHTRMALYKQLKEYIFEVDIKSYAIDEGIDIFISDSLVILSSNLVKDELIEMNLLDTKCEIIIAKRTISYDYIDKIVLLPKDTEVLFVNDVKETAYQSIEALRELGIDYLNYTPYYPGIEGNTPKIEIAITPGESDKAPRFVKKIYDIGPRIMDFTTIMKILSKLNLLDDRAGQFSQKYLQKIINMAKRLSHSTNQVSNLNKHLELVIDSLNDGLLVYDNSGYISVFNENLRKILKVNYKNFKGKFLKDVIFKKDILEFLMDNEQMGGRIFEVDSVEVGINKFMITKENYTVGIFKNIKDTIEHEHKLKRELINKGFYAKYIFDDIVGNSYKLNRTKEISKKLALTDLTILIEGESGTGKELFASAIHNSSKRVGGPFLAINFSSLPDELIESELFGYEEGAFTGAKKGGKEGLFEQADGGTIFLDEIGDISTKVQARLLRVLQEKEVMRIGGSKIKSVDVRIIAATNKDLVSMVKEKKFREDLYYRIKMGYIKLIPLRERKEDIIELIEYFLKIQTSEKVQISQEVITELLSYNWYGNVRELKNMISYMLAVRGGNNLILEDIPNKGFFQENNIHLDNQEDYDIELNYEERFLLEKISSISKKGEIVGRERLAHDTKGTKFEMTKYQARNRLDKLEQKGYIIKCKGKRGTRLSDKGRTILMGLMGSENS